jgi:hypothetical protein
MVWGGLILAIIVLVTAGHPKTTHSGNASAQGPKPELRRTRSQEHVIITAMIPLDGQPSAIAGDANEVAILMRGQVEAFDPSSMYDPPGSTDVGPDAYAVAVAGRQMATVGAGTVSLHDQPSSHGDDAPVPFGELPGNLAFGPGAAWICNVAHSKLDRLDLSTHTLRHLPVPGPPSDVVVDGARVWVAVQDDRDDVGWLVEFDSEGVELGRWRIPPHPGKIAVGFGFVWITYAREIVRSSEATGHVVGPPIRVAPGTDSLAKYRESMWATSSNADVLQRIDPRKGRVVYHRTVPAQPIGIVVSADRLFTASAQQDTLVQLTVIP